MGRIRRLHGEPPVSKSRADADIGVCPPQKKDIGYPTVDDAKFSTLFSESIEEGRKTAARRLLRCHDAYCDLFFNKDITEEKDRHLLFKKGFIICRMIIIISFFGLTGSFLEIF